jgi:FKBP-type peptidyl-prolyl cis-trans isomerase
VLTPKLMWGYGALVIAFVVSGGCSEPPQFVNAAPPGEDYRRTIEVKDDGGEAIGEQVTKSTQPESSKPIVTSDAPPALPTAKGEVKTTPSGVKYETIKEGKGAVAKAGQRVTVHYVGTLDDGRKFDSSRDRREPKTFLIGAEKVIKGWDEAIPGMKIGEIRKLEIPPNAAYGAQGQPPTIAPNATLHFEVELINVE